MGDGRMTATARADIGAQYRSPLKRGSWVAYSFVMTFADGSSSFAIRARSRTLYLDHVEGDGRLLFEQIVAMDLEGIVCKRKDSPYKVTEKPSRYWIKVKNSRYSQLEGREELFERV